MITITQQIYLEEIAQAIFNDLKDKLLNKQRNHCIRVDYLPTPVMFSTCQKLNQDPKLQQHQVEAYVLADKKSNDCEIESGRLIELRNRLDFGVLLVFIPQGFKGAAEDSYDIHTFEQYDLAGVLANHKKVLINSFSEQEREIVSSIMDSSLARHQRIENQLRYILALKEDECTWETAGAYLHYLNMIPDLKLSAENVKSRLLRNGECVDLLSNTDSNIFLAIDAMVNKGLDPSAGNLKANLLNFFHERNRIDVPSWTAEILTNQDWLSKISFDKWRFIDLAGEKIELYLEPFRDRSGNPLASTGLTIEADSLFATSNTKLKLKWKTNPRKSTNVSQFVIILEKEESDDFSGELLRKTAKGISETCSFPFKDAEVNIGEEWLVHIRIVALDVNKAQIAEDTSEPFYLRGEDTTVTTGETRRFTPVRNLAEAILKATYRFKQQVTIESQGLETGRILLYRVKTSSKDTYHIPLNNVLYELEKKIIHDPMSCGAFDIDITNRGFIDVQDFSEVKINLSVFKSEFNDFLNARRELFHAISANDETAVIETLDLRLYAQQINDYVSAFVKLTDLISKDIQNLPDAQVSNLLANSACLNRIDTIHVSLGTSDQPEELLLMSPLHPLRLLWLLQYQNLLFSWSEGLLRLPESQYPKAIDIEGFEKILPLNLPNALSYEKGKIFVNTDVLDLYWSLFPESNTTDIRKVVAMVSKALGYRNDLGNISSVAPNQIADRIWRYLRQHPYIKTLKLNVLNPGDGMLFLNTIRELQKMDNFKDLRYDITFYGTMGYELMGSAFDELMSNQDPVDGSRPDIDEELLEPSHNPLFPKLFFSKVKVESGHWSDVQIREANLTVIIDQFVTKTISRPAGNIPGSYFLHGLLAEYRSEFNTMNGAVTWSRKVVPSPTAEINDGDNNAQLVYNLGSNLLGLTCSFFDWGKSSEYLPTIQLELSADDKFILNEIHKKSDWVFTIDRNFGIEYFDNPEDGNPNLNSYLIDYTPEFMDGVGHRLIVSTGWLNEIERLIADGLRKINIPTSSFRATKILDIIKSISGKLALKLINNPNNVKEIIGLAITRLSLEEKGMLNNAVLIPVDTHIGMFSENKRRNPDEDVTVKRSDLILITAKDNNLNVNLIEVKFRSDEGLITADMLLKEEIVKKNDNTEKTLRTIFISDDENPKIDVQLANKSLSTFIGFYLERAIRYGICKDGDALKQIVEAINVGDFQINFEKSGFIIHWAGAQKPDEVYNNNNIYNLGNKDICRLLEIRETEIEVKEDEKEIHQPETSTDVKTTNIDQTIDNSAQDVGQTTQPQTPMSNQTIPHIELGLDTDKGNKVVFDPVTMQPKKLANQHLLIVGKSGAGKSQTTSSILYELSKQEVPFLILDFQGEYVSSELHMSDGRSFEQVTGLRNFDPSFGMNINPLELASDSNTGNKTNFYNNVYQVGDTMKNIFGLGDIQYPMLKEAIKRAYSEKGFVKSDPTSWNNEPPQFEDIWTILEFMESHEGKKLSSLKYRIEPLFENEIFVSSSNNGSIDDILSQNSVINLSALPTPDLMKIVARFILQAVYNKMLSYGPSKDIRLYVVIDEAHKLSYDSTLTDLIREARKYGVGFILASQSVRDFATVVFENMGTKIALQLEGEDAKFMADNFGVSDKSIKEMVLRMLPQQKPLRALIRNNHYEPFTQVDIVPFYQKE